MRTTKTGDHHPGFFIGCEILLNDYTQLKILPLSERSDFFMASSDSKIPIAPTSGTRVRPVAWSVRAIVSLLVVLHFFLVVTTYAANWRRSGVQDDALSLCQPYVIGLNWYVEMLPIEWCKSDSADSKARLSVQSKSGTERSLLLDSTADTLDRAKKRNLLRLLVSVVEAGDDDGAALLLASMIKHAQNSREQTDPIVSVRLEKLLDVTDSSYSVLYEAAVKHSEAGKVQFLPALEPQRTVPAMNPRMSAPAS